MIYVQKSLKQAKELNWDAPPFTTWDEWSDDLYLSGIWEVEDEIGYKCIATDGGELEDQTLSRDWSWVVGALNRAYLQGVTDASSS